MQQSKLESAHLTAGLQKHSTQSPALLQRSQPQQCNTNPLEDLPLHDSAAKVVVSTAVIRGRWDRDLKHTSHVN